jgi:hypothetical protein
MPDSYDGKYCARSNRAVLSIRDYLDTLNEDAVHDLLSDILTDAMCMQSVERDDMTDGDFASAKMEVRRRLAAILTGDAIGDIHRRSGAFAGIDAGSKMTRADWLSMAKTVEDIHALAARWA